MPPYVIEFLSGQGPQRRRFTLDDDRPLRHQLEQVLAELERAGLVLQGAASDELAAYSMGRELDTAQPPTALGLSNDRPLELRMQRRRPSVPVPPVWEPPTESFVPKGVYVDAAWGMLAGMIAWGLTTLVTDHNALLANEARLDGLAAALWAGGVAMLVGWSDARRIDRPAATAAVVGAVAAVVLASGWMALVALVPTPGTPGMARVLRLGSWIGLALAAFAAIRIAAYATDTGLGSAAGGGATPRALGGVLAAGVGAGVLADLPGAVVLWSALANVVAGAGVGAAVARAAARGATAVLELETRDDRPVGIVSLREWLMRDGADASVRDVSRRADGGVVHVTYAAGRCRVQAADGSVASRELRNDDRLVVGRSCYRFRRRGAA